MKTIYYFLTTISIMTVACGSADVGLSMTERKKNPPNCNQLEVVELSFLKSKTSLMLGDTLKILVSNECETCQVRPYSGLIAYMGTDTLAIDFVLGGTPTPDNGQSKEYFLKISRLFDLEDITRLEMYLVCDSLTL